MSYSVSIHEVGRYYGGPEEGGWYYDAGQPAEELARYTRGFARRKDAVNYANKLRDTVEVELNEGRYPIHSVLSDYVYYVMVQEGQPHAWPKERPYYD